jgi:hypothetical protein
VLDRIERLDVPPLASPRRTPTRVMGRATPRPAPAEPTSIRGPRWAIATILLIAAGVGAAAVGLWGAAASPDLGAFTLFSSGVPERSIVLTPASPEPLPVPAATEAFLARAQALFASGRLRDALNELARIPLGDALRDDADALRGQIQRELLAVAAAEPAPPAEAVPPPQPPNE